MCSAADDPTTYDYNPYSRMDDETRLEHRIAVCNIAWARWQDAADKLYDEAQVVDRNTPGFYRDYNDAQRDYEFAVSALMSEQARYRSRHRA